jgi:hypothetical protein
MKALFTDVSVQAASLRTDGIARPITKSCSGQIGWFVICDVEGAGNTGRIGHLFALWPVSPHSSHIEFCI